MLRRLDDAVKLARIHVPGWPWSPLDVFVAGCDQALPVYLSDPSELPEHLRVGENSRAPFANRILRPVTADVLNHVAGAVPPGLHRSLRALDREIVLSTTGRFEIVRRTALAYVDQCLVEDDDLLRWGRGEPSETATWDPCAIAILARPPALATNVSEWARMLVFYLATDHPRGGWKQADLRRLIEASWPRPLEQAAIEKAISRAVNDAYASTSLDVELSV